VKESGRGLIDVAWNIPGEIEENNEKSV